MKSELLLLFFLVSIRTTMDTIGLQNSGERMESAKNYGLKKFFDGVVVIVIGVV